MMITIKDVARETNLAISTISKYMNGGKVRAANEQAIREAIRKLGYQPNKAARGLRSSQTFTVGLMLGGLDSPYFSAICAEIEKRLRERGYSMVVCCHKDSAALAERAAQFLLSRQVDGIIAVPIEGGRDYAQAVTAGKVPLVALDRMPRHLVCDSVSSNAATGAYQAVEYLIAQGHERIAVITGTRPGTSGIVTAEERYRGYARALEDYQIPLMEAYVQGGDFSFDSGYRCMETLWKLEDRPTAVFVTNYNMMLGTVIFLRNARAAVPGELSIAAFDDLKFCRVSKPKITAVRQPAEDIARESVKLLLRRIEGDYSDFPRKLKLPTALIERESVKKRIKE